VDWTARRARCPAGATSAHWNPVRQHGRDAIVVTFPARAERKTTIRRGEYALRAGVESTVNQALDRTGLRRARYRGLPKVRLQHAFSATALNVIRLDAYWTQTPANPRTSRLTRLRDQLASRPSKLGSRDIAGDNTGRLTNWYRRAIPRAEALYEIYPKERAEEEGGRR
jgi:hypothetical protein